MYVLTLGVKRLMSHDSWPGLVVTHPAFNVASAQNFLQNCGKSSWLRTETVSSSTSECQTIDLRPVQSHVFMQTWQLLALCTALFAPRGKFLPYLKAHLNRCRNLK